MVVLSNFAQPTEGIRLEQHGTTAHLNNNNLGKGTLYIAESRLSWIGSNGNGFSIEYPHISLHAVSRDLNAFPEECLFLMLDTNVDDEMNDIDEDADYETTTELRFVPEDRGMLDAMFDAMSVCQALHPDPQDSFSDDDLFEDADEDGPINETNSQMANLCIEQSRFASSAEGSREAAGRGHRSTGSAAAAGDRADSTAAEDKGNKSAVGAEEDTQ